MQSKLRKKLKKNSFRRKYSFLKVSLEANISYLLYTESANRPKLNI